MSSSSTTTCSAAPAARLAKKWFPPATFQLRLRSMSKVVFVPPEDEESGQDEQEKCYFTLHLSPASEPFFSSPISSKSSNSFSWPEVSIPEEYGALLGCVFKIWSEGIQRPRFVARVGLSGMQCVGIHLPPVVPGPQPSLVLRLAGSHFQASSDPAAVDVSRHLFFGPFQNNKPLDSYSASLLCRLQRLHRAAEQQETANRQLIELLERRGLTRDRSRFESFKQEDHSRKEAKTSMMIRGRDFFDRALQPEARVEEAEIRGKIEVLRLRTRQRRLERASLEESLARKREEGERLRREIDESNTQLMTRLHNFSRDRAGLREWKDRHRHLLSDPKNDDNNDNNNSDEQSAGLVGRLGQAVQAGRYRLLADLRRLFPIQDLDKPTPALRWVTLPSLDRARSHSRDEAALSVCLGWAAHAANTAASVLDAPLRYPLVLRGSSSGVIDPAKNGEVFPLYAKGAEAARTDYAIFLLNKNMAQIRWLCGLVTTDLRLTLKNLDELLSLASSDDQDQETKNKSGRDGGLSPESRNLLSSSKSAHAQMKPPSSSDINLLASPSKKKVENKSEVDEDEVPSNGTKDNGKLQIQAIKGDSDVISLKKAGVAPLNEGVIPSKVGGSPLTVSSSENKSVGNAVQSGDHLQNDRDALNKDPDHNKSDNDEDHDDNDDDYDKSDEDDDTWTEFANRTEALSAGPTSFHRRNKNKS